MLRLLKTLLVTLLVVLGLPLVQVQPASALEQPPIVIGPNDRIEVNYDPILVPNPANEADDPETCRTAPYCYTIPLHLNRPADLDADEEFTLRFRMSWQVDVEDVEVPVQGEVTSNDLDLKIWNAPYVATDPNTGEATEAANTGAATGAQPEKTSMNTPPNDDYFLVITNFVGLNRGVKLTISWDPEVFDAPAEDLGGGLRDASADTSAVTPTYSGAADGGYSSTVSPLSGLNPASIDPSVGADAGSFSSTTLSPLATGADDFIGDGASNDLESELLDEARRLTARPATSVRPAGPVDGSLVLFWLGLVPLVLLAAAAVWLVRRRPAALAFS